MISQNMSPESSTTGELWACWHLFCRVQELTAFHPPEFLARRILFRTFFNVFWIPIAHQITQQQNWNQVERENSYLECTTIELYLFCSLPSRKLVLCLSIAHVPLSQALSLVYHIVYHLCSISDLTEELCNLKVKVGGLKSVWPNFFNHLKNKLRRLYKQTSPSHLKINKTYHEIIKQMQNGEIS